MKYIENKNLLKYRFSNGMLMLPFFRYEIMCNLNKKKSEKKQTPLRKKQRKNYLSLLLNLRKNVIYEKDIVFFTSTDFNVKDEQGNYYNNLDGYYYNLCKDDALLVEDSNNLFEWKKTKRYTTISYFKTYLIFLSSIFAKFYAKLHLGKHEMLNAFGTETGINILNLKYSQGFVISLAYLYRIILKKIKPSKIFVNCGSYGMDYAILIKCAHELGIRVIELQHGAIDDGHLAYHVDDFIANNIEYQEYLPDELWLFGEYWANSIEWKYKKKVVGNPHLNSQIKKIKKSNEGYDYMVIAQPEVESIIIKFVDSLAKKYPKDKILLRLHPRDILENYQSKLKDYVNIEYSNSTSPLYEEISKSYYIVGAYSTCLYEALALQKNPIIVDCNLSRRHFPKNIGYWVKDADSIDQEKLKQNEVINTEYYWAVNFEDNVRKYMY